jgi:hypothetical protein
VGPLAAIGLLFAGLLANMPEYVAERSGRARSASKPTIVLIRGAFADASS